MNCASPASPGGPVTAVSVCVLCRRSSLSPPRAGFQRTELRRAVLSTSIAAAADAELSRSRTEVGAITSAGPSAARVTSSAMIYRVLPRPMSSAEAHPPSPSSDNLHRRTNPSR